MSDSLAKAMAQIRQVKALKKMKREMRAHRRSVRNPLVAVPTLKLVPALLPTYDEPVHLTPMAETLERSWVEPVRATFHAPPQHGKTYLLSVWVVATLLRYPHLRIVYVTFNASTAAEKSGKMRQLAREAGVQISDDTDAKAEWVTTAGGGVYACGVAQGFTGRAADIIIVDDPYGDRKQARSKAWQTTVSSFWTDIVETRARENTSIFVQHTRWTPTDLIGLLKAGKLSSSSAGVRKFVHISLAAENDNGDPLWPQNEAGTAGYSRELLAAKKVNLVTWWSLYMGEPRPEGSEVFSNEVVTYDPEAMRERLDALVHSFGLDFAYTASTSADSSVIIEMCREGRGPTARYYLRERISLQVTAPVFVMRVKAARARRPHARVRAYVAGVERGATAYLTAPPPAGAGLSGVDIRSASADKLVRALPVSEAWNGKRLFVPVGAPWATDFVENLGAFTGGGGAEDDDDIDALAAAYDELAANTGAGGGATDDEPDFGDRAAMLM